MKQLVKALAINSLTSGILLIVAACGESPRANPVPASPPLVVEKITLPEGVTQMDSASFERAMRGPMPDSLPRPVSAPPRPAVSPFLLKKPEHSNGNKQSTRR